MPNTPTVDPPIVTRDDARVLIHEAALAAILTGLKKARPELFLYASFNVDPKNKRDPIRIPNPAGGPDLLFNYRIDLSQSALDIAPPDVTAGGFADPFNLAPGIIAVYATVTIDLAGDPITTWQVRISAGVWLECGISLAADGWLDLILLDASIKIDQLSNSALLNAMNHMIHDYLHTIIPQFRVPITPLVNTEWFSVAPTLFLLQLDSVDLSVAVSMKG